MILNDRRNEAILVKLQILDREHAPNSTEGPAGSLGLSRRGQLILLALLALPLIGYWMHGLFDLDEGFYGAVTREMNWRHEWLVPYYQGVPWFEKPILIYWLAKPFLALLGPDFGLRLPTILVSLAFTWQVGLFAEKHFGRGYGRSAMLALAGSLLWAALSRQFMTDILLATSWSLAVLWFWELITGPPNLKLSLGVGILLGLGVLAKGPVSVILFVPVMVYGLFLTRQTKKSARDVVAAILALVLTVSTWYIPVYLAQGQVFVQEFLVNQNLKRFSGGDAAHTWSGPQNWFFFVPVMLLGAAPWSFFLFKHWPRKSAPELPRYLACALLVPFLFFTVSGAKLVHYVLPCMPFVILVACSAGVMQARQKLLSGWLVGVALLTNIGFPIYYRLSGQEELHRIARNLNQHDGSIIAYQMPRREKELGTGQLKLRETSLPSIEVYTQVPVLNAETIERRGTEIWITNPGRPDQTITSPVTVLTRKGRVLPNLGWTKVFSGERFEEYRLP